MVLIAFIRKRIGFWNRKSEILLKGKFYDYPVNVKNAVFSMGALKIIQIGIDYITTVLKNKISSKPDDSF